MPYTCECSETFDLAAALDALPSDRMGRSGMFSPACRCCGQSMEIRLGNNGYDVGYSYFGGSMHFEPVKWVAAKGLTIAPDDPDDLEVTFAGKTWHFGIRHMSRQRFCVLPQSFASGRRVDEMDFSQWGVTLDSMERNREMISFQDDTVIKPGDFLCLTGPSPALTRAWHYMNDGLPISGSGPEPVADFVQRTRTQPP